MGTAPRGDGAGIALGTATSVDGFRPIPSESDIASGTPEGQWRALISTHTCEGVFQGEPSPAPISEWVRHELER